MADPDFFTAYFADKMFVIYFIQCFLSNIQQKEYHILFAVYPQYAQATLQHQYDIYF